MTRVFDEDLAAGFGTKAIHAGQRPEPLAGAIMTPVYLTSTYVQEGLGRNKGYEYARGKNPTREAFERNVAALENGRHGFAFASGMGCLDSIMKLFRAGDHIICAENVYGGTFRLFDKILQHFGLSFSYVDTRDAQRVADAMTPATRAVLVETPSNPLMRLTDIAAAAEIAHRGHALLIVDNTFASPYFQRPLELGADIVYHSTTKYLNGHSDMIGGSPSVCSSSTTQRVPSPGRSTRGLPFAEQRRSISGCVSMTPMGARLQSGWPTWSDTKTCTTSACRVTRNTSWQSGRCPGSAE
jgi:cystathionine beta-lyase/cystathionine gamma-synthase